MLAVCVENAQFSFLPEGEPEDSSSADNNLTKISLTHPLLSSI